MRLIYSGGKDARHLVIPMPGTCGCLYHDCITPWKFSHTKKTIWAYCEEHDIKFILDEDN